MKIFPSDNPFVPRDIGQPTIMSWETKIAVLKRLMKHQETDVDHLMGHLAGAGYVVTVRQNIPEGPGGRVVEAMAQNHESTLIHRGGAVLSAVLGLTGKVIYDIEQKRLA